VTLLLIKKVTDPHARSKASEQLLSSDTHSNTANFKYTFSVEIVPICKDDLVCIPLKQARSLGNISPLTVCVRVGNSIQLLDPQTLQSCEVPSQIYWRSPFNSLAMVTDLVEFTVLDVDPDYSRKKGKLVPADAQVALSGAFLSKKGENLDSMVTDYESNGLNNQIFHTRTHLGAILQPGDTALGYFLTNSNYNSDHFASIPPSRVPDIILVKKAYPNRRKKSKARNWKLRSIAKEAGEEGETGNARGAIGRMGGRDQKKVEEDYELFLRDLEEDPEMRSSVNLYKDVKMAGPTKSRGGKRAHYAMDVDESEVPPTVPQSGTDGDSAGAEAEPDFPDVRLDELLEEFDEMALGHDEEDHDP
jgi:nonsense-mediated mRNA decay protein 3